MEDLRSCCAHVVAIPYPAQGHIAPLMQFCKKLATENGFRVTFVNTEHNHARMVEATEEGFMGNIRLMGVAGGLPPELHGDPDHVVAAFRASEAIRGPFDKLLEQLAQDGNPATLIVSDVLLSWTQDCAEKARVPRVAFWTSSAAVYHVIWHTYGLISSGKRSFKENDPRSAEIVSCIPGLPPMNLNDLPIIVRSDPADFIYQFLSRQLACIPRAAAILLNTFLELERDCLQALFDTSPVPIYAIGPLLPTSGNHGASNSEFGTAGCTYGSNRALKDRKREGRPGYCPQYQTPDVGRPIPKAGNAFTRHQTERAGQGTTEYKSAGIFREDASCLEWLDKQESGSVLYISFGSIFNMSSEQFGELMEGLQATKLPFLWAIRPGFVRGWSHYSSLLSSLFLESTKDRGLLVSWAPQLSVLAHRAVKGFLTHCGWNSTLESVSLGVPMLCWPDVGERRTNGRLTVAVWKAGLELRAGTLLICRQEVQAMILKLMDPCSQVAARLRAETRSLESSARRAVSQGGSSWRAWNRFLSQTIKH